MVTCVILAGGWTARPPNRGLRTCHVSPKGRLGMTGVCGMKKERACWRRAWGTHKSSLYKRGWALDDGRALWLVTDFLLLRNIPMWRSTLCSRGHGAKERCARREGCEEGHSCQRTHKLRFSHRMTQRQRVFAWGREPEGSCKVLFPQGRGRHCWKSDETGRLSGLLVAVLDRDSVLSHSASDPPTWVVTRDEPTDKTDARKSGFPT